MNKQRIIPLVVLTILSVAIIVNVSAQSRGWQSDEFRLGFSTQGGEKLEYGPYVYYPQTIYVTYDDAIPDGRTLNVTIKYPGFDTTWELDEGESTTTCSPGGAKVFVYFTATDYLTLGDYDVECTVHYYD